LAAQRELLLVADAGVGIGHAVAVGLGLLHHLAVDRDRDLDRPTAVALREDRDHLQRLPCLRLSTESGLRHVPSQHTTLSAQLLITSLKSS
jgi:hypothetical protein